MTSMNAFRPLAPIHFVHKIREVAANSWWVYRHEIGVDGYLKPMPRVVFFGRNQNEVDQWVTQQKEEQSMFVLSDN